MSSLRYSSEDAGWGVGRPLTLYTVLFLAYDRYTFEHRNLFYMELFIRTLRLATRYKSFSTEAYSPCMLMPHCLLHVHLGINHTVESECNFITLDYAPKFSSLTLTLRMPFLCLQENCTGQEQKLLKFILVSLFTVIRSETHDCMSVSGLFLL